MKDNKDWSFCICTDGSNNRSYHEDIIKSIREQGIPNYEIIFCTENEYFKKEDFDTRTIYVNSPIRGWITGKKNLLAKEAKYENLCFLHDYIVLTHDWYDGFKSFDVDWDICSNIFIDIRGVRIMDWATLDHPVWRHKCIPYELQDSETRKYLYISGAFFNTKKNVLLETPFDEKKFHGDCEDVEWSERARKKHMIKLNTNSVALSLKEKPGFENYILKLEDIKFPIETGE